MSRLLPRFDRLAQEAADAKKLARILLETGSPLPVSASKSSLPGDARALRGLPAVGVRGGLGGAIAGTRPGSSSSLDAWSPQAPVAGADS
ncbi:MAG TPA: hypothetical protein VM204_03430 [Gaiellaceae bacterium]|nr:hypothetical protein [Gaiellaceae bacterium]